MPLLSLISAKIAVDELAWSSNTACLPMPLLLQNGEAAAIRKVKVLSWTGVGSFIFSTFKWFFQGRDYACGFAAWPTFGMAAMKYTWNFDFQLNYVGAGGERALGQCLTRLYQLRWQG